MEAVGAAFGIADVALRTSSKLWTLSGAWRDAPGDLERLRDDLSRTQRFFAETQEGINAMYGLGPRVQKESHSSYREMERLIDEGYAVLEQIEEFVDSLNRPTGLDMPQDLGKRRRIIWMTSTGKVCKLRNELRSITSNVCRLLIAQNVSMSAEIYMSLDKSHDDLASYVSDRVTAHTEQSLKSYQNVTISHLGKALELSQHEIISHMDRRLELLERKMTSTPSGRGGKPGGNNISLSLQQIQLQVSLGQRSRQGRDHEQHSNQPGSPDQSERSTSPASSPPGRDLVSSPRKPGNLCDDTCQCRCHAPSTYHWVMTSMRAILGDISLNYRGVSTRCTLKSCRRFGQSRRQSRRVHVLYSFPSWLARATLYMLYSSSLSGNPEMVIRVMNRLPLSQLQPNSIFGRARAGDTEGVKALLRDKTVCVNDVIANTGISALLLAIVYGDPEMARVLLQAGADPFQETLAGTGNAVSYAFQLMLNGKRIETARLFPIDRFIEDMEFPPLSRIVMGDLHVDLAQALQSAEYAADINFVSEVGWTPLDIAVHKGDVEAMKLLIKAGADLNVATGPRLSTPLLRACINGNYEAAKVLLEAGADPRKQDRESNGPITNAAKAEVDTSRLISLLMRYGIDIETPGGPSQSPPLVLAVVEGTVETVRYLLSRGANIDWRDSDGDTPIIDAIIRGHCDKVELLMEHGCNIQNVNNQGQGVLHFVASHGTRDVMKVFASKKMTKLDPAAKDKQGRTPMNYFNGRHPPPTPEYRETFDEMLDSLERGFYGIDADSDGQEFFEARETLN